MEAIQGMTNAMNAIANQVIRNSGSSGRNAGWPYFDGTFRDYPAFKRKFESFQMTYHRGTPTRELFQQFREMCLPEKLFAKIKSANTMENAWIRLEAWFGDKALFIKDLMQDIKSVTPIKEGDVLPKATPFQRSQRSPSSEGRGGRYSRPGSFGRNAKVMAVTESRSADRKKVRFPPPKAWDPEAKWTQDCVMFKVCGEKHTPGSATLSRSCPHSRG